MPSDYITKLNIVQYNVQLPDINNNIFEKNWFNLKGDQNDQSGKGYKGKDHSCDD